VHTDVFRQFAHLADDSAATSTADYTPAIIALIAVVVVAVITAASTSLATWLTNEGAGRREERARKAAQGVASDARRFERAEGFIDAVAAAAQQPSTEAERWRVTVARAGFLATLRPGEERAGWLTNRIVAVVLDSTTADRRTLLDEHVDLLFRWLRGEVDVNELEVPPAHWGEVKIAEPPTTLSFGSGVTFTPGPA
jgi:Flp pilus assembly pilin Flp